MPAHLRLARPFRVRTVAVLAAALIAASPGAFAQLASGAPRPVRSADLSALEAEISATPAQRKSFGEAMDRYVARWQKLRDGDLAKAIRAEDDVTIAQVDSFREFEPNAEPPQPDPEADRRRADAVAQMRAAVGDALDAQGAFLDALRAAVDADPAATDAQRAAVRSWCVGQRRRTLLRAVRGSMPGMFAPSGELPVPPVEMLADPALRAAVAARVAAFERDSVASLEKQVRAPGGPQLSPYSEADDGEALVPLRGSAVDGIEQLRAIEDIAALLPAEAREKWIRPARARALRGVLRPWPALADPWGELPAVTGASSRAAEARIARWRADRDAADAALKDTKTENDLLRRQQQMVEIDETALAELHELTGDPAFELAAFRQATMTRAMRERMSAAREQPEDDESGMFAAMDAVAQRSRSAGGDDDVAETESGSEEDRFRQLGKLRIARRSDLEAIRSRLGVPEQERALWDTMAADLLSKLAAAREAASPDQDAMFGTPDAAALDRATSSRRRFLDAIAADENAWFDAIPGAFPSIGKDRVETERGRRTLRRVLEASSLMLSISRFSGNRWIDLDLDTAADALPAPARAAAEPTLAAWRLRKAQDIVRLTDVTERAISEQAGLQSDGEPDIAAAQDRMVRMKRDLDEASARADAEQRAAEASIASSLSPALAAQFRHAVRRQTYPEIYRDHDRLDAAIGRAMADESLTGEQKVELAVAWDELRTRFDPLAESLAAAVGDAETAMGGLMGAAGDPSAAMVAFRKQRDAAARRGALDYDAEELRARAVRAVREAIGDAKAEAAGVR